MGSSEIATKVGDPDKITGHSIALITHLVHEESVFPYCVAINAAGHQTLGIEVAGDLSGGIRTMTSGHLEGIGELNRLRAGLEQAICQIVIQTCC